MSHINWGAAESGTDTDTTDGDPPDQVKRLWEFETAHPEMHIWSERDGFNVVWYARNDTTNKEIKVFGELEKLLDELEARVTR